MPENSSRDRHDFVVNHVKIISSEASDDDQTEHKCGYPDLTFNEQQIYVFDTGTPQEYAKRIYNFSRLETGIGFNFHDIAKFIGPRYSKNPDLPNDFVTIYQLSLQRPSRSCHDVRKLDEFEQLKPYDRNKTSNHIIFFKGYPSAKWLRIIGSKCRVDPEFYRRHYEFDSMLRPRTLDFTSLPSSSLRMFELVVTSVQTVPTVVRPLSRKWSGLEQRINTNKSAMESYTRELILGNVTPGDPVVRNYTMIDASLSALEQKISVYLHGNNNKWTRSLFVCVDGSKDLSLASRGPWFALTPSGRKIKRIFTEPILNYTPSLALKPHLVRNNTSGQWHFSPKQSTARLHHDYGRSLQPEIMARDPVYALKEIFELLAHAELQFLAYCDEGLTELQESKVSNDAEFLPSLKNIKGLLHRHLHQNRNALQSLENITRQQWPSTDSGYTETKALSLDFSRLIELNDHLHNQCVESIGLLMNEMVIAESKKARDQATRIGKLTLLAFIFVPLSFTASFFGMNFKGLGAESGALSIWTWFVVSMPLLAMAILFFIYDSSELWQFCVRFGNFILRSFPRDRFASKKESDTQPPRFINDISSGEPA